MTKCPFCDHRNPENATECEACKAPLKKDIPTNVAPAQGSQENEEVNAPEPGSLEDEILSLLKGRKKIEAIKLYREKTNSGLKKAKDFVEALAVKYHVPPSSDGCAGMVLLMVVAGVGVAHAAWMLLS
jgi:hypothetical protein